MTSLRVMVVHCRYILRGGEDAVFEAEVEQLRSNGITVDAFEKQNVDVRASSPIQKVRAGLATIWSLSARSELAKRLDKFQPNVIHFHNTFPTLSPSVYYECRKREIPVIQTLHNYRLFCAAATFLRDGKICEDCLDGGFFNGFRHACYRDSRLASGALVSMQYLHHGIGTYAKAIDRFIALTEFSKGKFVQGGISAEKISVKPNSLAFDPGLGGGRGDYALYVGRLSGEKGLRTLIAAWRKIKDLRLVIAGDGPIADELLLGANDMGAQIQFLGGLERQQVIELMKSALFLVVPSEWYEGFPMTIVEAYATGLPVVASNIGSLSEVVVPGETGELFSPGNPGSLCAAISRISHDPSQLDVLRTKARSRFDQLYSADANVKALMQIYSSAIRAKSVSPTANQFS